MSSSVLQDVEAFRDQFDSLYVGAIPRLMDDDGGFLAFLCMVSAIDALAGLWSPTCGSGERFRSFVEEFFPSGLRERGADLWGFRNSMVHACNPGVSFTLVVNRSRLHLTPNGTTTMLNAQDFYAALVIAAQEYFRRLVSDVALRSNFARRMVDAGGGVPDSLLAMRVE